MSEHGAGANGTDVADDGLRQDIAGTRPADDATPPRRSTTWTWAAVIGAVGAVAVVAVGAWLWASHDDQAVRDALVGRRFVVASITEDGRPKFLRGPAI